MVGTEDYHGRHSCEGFDAAGARVGGWGGSALEGVCAGGGGWLVRMVWRGFTGGDWQHTRQCVAFWGGGGGDTLRCASES